MNRTTLVVAFAALILTTPVAAFTVTGFIHENAPINVKAVHQVVLPSTDPWTSFEGDGKLFNGFTDEVALSGNRPYSNSKDTTLTWFLCWAYVADTDVVFLGGAPASASFQDTFSPFDETCFCI